MTDQRIQSTDEMVGANHSTKTDTLNRLSLIEHNTDGTHKVSAATLYEYTPAGSTTTITTGGTYVKWAHSTKGIETGAGYIVSSTSTDDMTIGASGAGWYDTFISASVAGQGGLEVSIAVFKNGTRMDNLTRTVTLSGAHEHLADAVDLKLGTLNSGTVADTASKDENYYDIQEVAEPTGFIVQFTFSGDVVAPLAINFAGLYTGNAAHEVEAQILDATATIDRVQNGGTAYNCLRSHTSGAAADEPGVGADWTSWWESDGAASGEAAWVTSTAYDDAFDELRSAVKDLPAETIDYTRRWIVPGTHATRQKYSDSNGDAIVRFIHNSSGTVSGNSLKVDRLTLDDDHAGASITTSDIIDVSASDVFDMRITTSEDSSQVVTTNVNFKMKRVKI